MSVDRFNSLPEAEAVTELLACCGSHGWAEVLSAQRPFPSADVLLEAAERVWFGMAEADCLEAIAQHPRIGERATVTSAYLAHSNAEQAVAQSTLDQVAQQLIDCNLAYENRFGFRYLVFASGRSAPELLAILEDRLTHTREEELQEAARQQHRITALRMAKWLEEPAQ